MVSIEGSYAYIIQGFMVARNIFNQNPESPKPLTMAVGTTVQQANFELIALPGLSLTQQERPDAIKQGYYPYAESGYMTLHQGMVTGALRNNVAGAGLLFGQHVDEFPMHFTGSYSLQSPLGAPSAGIISLVITENTALHWDYSFFVISDDECLLMSGGRIVRPLTATGSMKRIAQNVLRP